SPVEWRVGHNVVERPRREARRRVQQVSDHDRGAGLEPVQNEVVAGQAHKIALHFEADEAGMRHARSKTQHRRPRPTPDIEYQLMWFRRDRGGEEYRIDRDAVTGRGLLEANAAAEQAVFGKRGLFRRTLGHCTASPAAARTERAR